MKMAVVVGSVLTVACLAAVFGVTILANEVSKETKVSNGSLVNRNGQTVGTAVTSARKISNLEGGLAAFYTLGKGDSFGSSVVALGDVNGDGITDLAVGAYLAYDDDGGTWAGAVYVLFMNVTVIGAQKISNDYGGLSAFYTLDAYELSLIHISEPTRPY